MTVLDDLRATREVLLERGWFQGWLHNELGNVCLMGALNVACFGVVCPSKEQLKDNTRRGPAYDALLAHVPPRPNDIVVDIAEYNDDDGTEFEDILCLVDRTMADVS